MPQFRGVQDNARVGRYDVRHQTLVPWHVLARDSDALRYTRMLSQRGLDLSQLDAEAADFDLLIDSMEKLDTAIRQAANQVAGSIKLRPRLAAEGIVHEPFACQIRPVQIAFGDAVTADVELARLSSRYKFREWIEDVKRGVGNRGVR